VAVIVANTDSAVSRVGVWAAAFLTVILIGISRIYLGVHYPSDLVAGYAIAIFWVVSVRTFFGFHWNAEFVVGRRMRTVGFPAGER
jgi:membrane-associated phospholipid phosphatase